MIDLQELEIKGWEQKTSFGGEWRTDLYEAKVPRGSWSQGVSK
jgi:hypothetical protein